MKRLSYSAAIADGMREEMKRDPTVIQIGLDLESYGDSLGQTLGLGEEFGKKRVMDFPISETTYTGIGVAAAATGLSSQALCEHFFFFVSTSHAHASRVMV